MTEGSTKVQVLLVHCSGMSSVNQKVFKYIDSYLSHMMRSSEIGSPGLVQELNCFLKDLTSVYI